MSEKQFTKEEMQMWVKSIIKNLPVHTEPSEETCRRLDKLEFALFGDPSNPDDHGMQVMITEMYKTFSGAKFTTKAVLYIFAAIGIITGGIFSLIKFLKALIS